MLEDAQNQYNLKKDRVYLDGVTKMELEFFKFIDNEMNNLNEDTVF